MKNKMILFFIFYSGASGVGRREWGASTGASGVGFLFSILFCFLLFRDFISIVTIISKSSGDLLDKTTFLI